MTYRVLVMCLVFASSQGSFIAAQEKTNIPYQIMLSIGGNPTSDYTVTWRTKQNVAKTIVQITEAVPSPKLKENAVEVEGITVSDYGDNSNLFSHKVRLTALQPNTLYAYRVGDGDVWSEWFHFRTAKKEKGSFSFLYFGDVQDDIKSLGSRTLRQAYSHFGGKASFMLFAGDLVANSTDSDWNEFFDAGGWILGTLPSASTPGNHEYDYSRDGGSKAFSTHWSHIYGMPRNSPIAEYQDRFYYFDYQGVRFISVDSPVIEEDNEHLNTVLEWLEATLIQNPNDWTIVLTHYPIFSCSSGRNNQEYRKILQPILEKYGVDMVLQGHDHTYCRGFNVANIADDVKNPPLYVVSVAGSKMYELEEKIWSEVTGENKQLYQYIEVKGNTVSYDSYDATGSLFDSFRLVKDENGVNTLIENPFFTDSHITSF